MAKKNKKQKTIERGKIVTHHPSATNIQGLQGVDHMQFTFSGTGNRNRGKT